MTTEIAKNHDSHPEHHNLAWWLGVADVATVSVEELAVALERAHLSIADETFDILAKIPVTRPVSETVRTTHHGIARLVYRSIGGCGRLANDAVHALKGH